MRAADAGRYAAYFSESRCYGNLYYSPEEGSIGESWWLGYIADGYEKKKRAACVAVDSERLISELQSSDETVRAKAVRSLCPCHAGWELFERHIGIVSQLEKDHSPAVRAHALHVFEDAVEMHSVETPTIGFRLLRRWHARSWRRGSAPKRRSGKAKGVEEAASFYGKRGITSHSSRPRIARLSSRTCVGSRLNARRLNSSVIALL